MWGRSRENTTAEKRLSFAAAIPMDANAHSLYNILAPAPVEQLSLLQSPSQPGDCSHCQTRSSANQNSSLSYRHMLDTLVSGKSLRKTPRVQIEAAIRSQFAWLLFRGCKWKEARTDITLQLADWWSARYVVQLPSVLAWASEDSHSSYWMRVTM